jgi:hypothetical protein
VDAEHILLREPTDVMLVRVEDQLPEIQRAWASFETKVGLQGRKFYGAFDPVSDTYSVCAVLRPVMIPPSSVPSAARSREAGTRVSVSAENLQASTS